MTKKAMILRAILLTTALGTVFSFGSLFLFALDQVQPPLESKDIRRDIQILNLVNGLELTPSQRQFLRDKALAYQKLREEALSFYLSRQPELNQVLGQIRQLRLENRDIPPELARRFHQLDNELQEQRLRIQEASRFLAEEIARRLEPHQLHALENYVPCIIPPKGESRIGQAADFKGLGVKLARLRNIPEWAYARRKNDLINRTIEEIKLKGGRLLNGEDSEEMAARIGLFYDKVRAMSEVDFEIQKEKLAQEFLTIIRPELPPLDVTRKIEAFLLTPEIIPILEANQNKSGR